MASDDTTASNGPFERQRVVEPCGHELDARVAAEAAPRRLEHRRRHVDADGSGVRVRRQARATPAGRRRNRGRAPARAGSRRGRAPARPRPHAGAAGGPHARGSGRRDPDRLQRFVIARLPHSVDRIARRPPTRARARHAIPIVSRAHVWLWRPIVVPPGRKNSVATIGVVGTERGDHRVAQGAVVADVRRARPPRRDRVRGRTGSRGCRSERHAGRSRTIDPARRGPRATSDAS